MKSAFTYKGFLVGALMSLLCGGGAVYGKSDRVGAYPESNPVHPQDIHATVLHAMGIPLNLAADNSGVSRPLTAGKPILDIFG